VGEANILRGQARSGTVTCALGELPVSGPDGDVSVVVRPEALVLGDEGTPARIVARDYVGREEVGWIAVDGADEPLSCRLWPGEASEATHVSVRAPVCWVGV